MQSDHQRSDYNRRPIVHGPLLVPSSDPTPLFESVYTPLHHVAPRVNLGVEARRSSRAFGPSLALVAPLGDRVRDAAVLESLRQLGKLKLLSAIRRSGRLRGRPEPERATRIASSTAPSCVLSWRCPAVTTTDSGRPLPSQERCNLVLSPPRLLPSASSSGCSIPLFRLLSSVCGAHPPRAGVPGPPCCRR